MIDVPMLSKINAVLFLALLSFAVLGCGTDIEDQPEIAAVNGFVTLDGEPGQKLQVVFTPKEGRPSQAITDEGGAFELNYIRDIAGAKVGQHSVQITTLPDASSDRPEEMVPFTETIPPEFNTKTTLTADVIPGENTFVFDVTTK